MDSVSNLNNNNLNSYIDKLNAAGTSQVSQQTGLQKPADDSDKAKVKSSDFVSVSDEAIAGEAPQGPANSESDNGVCALIGAWENGDETAPGACPPEPGDPGKADDPGAFPPAFGAPGAGEEPAIQWTPVSDGASISGSGMNSPASSAPATGLDAPVGFRSSASARETNAADPRVSKDVKDIAGRLMESDDVKNPSKDINSRFGTFKMTPENITVLAASGKDDNIHVSKGENGGIVVSVNGEEYSYSDYEAQNLIIDAGAGNDKITVDKEVTNELHITGGKGNDTIKSGSGNDIIVDNYGANNIDGGAGDDEIIAHGHGNSGFGRADNILKGGAGNDYIEGGRGNDIIDGGEGNDYIYGLDGNDIILGGEGDDYIDGGKGNDIIYGNEGNDKLFGGKGNDKIFGGAGNDVIAGGKGHDKIDGGSGADHIAVYAKSPSLTGITGAIQNLANQDDIKADLSDNITEVPYMDKVPGNISVKGSQDFKARVDSDLETMTAIPPGQAALNALGGDGHNLTIRETHAGSHVNPESDEAFISYNENNVASRGKGADSELAYNVSEHNLYGGENSWDETAPMTGLVHEMGHAYDNALGQADPAYYDQRTHEHLVEPDGSFTQSQFGQANWTHIGEPGYEYQTIGGMGYSWLPNDGVERTEHPKGFSENAMRQFLGEPERDSYASSPNFNPQIDTKSL